MFQTDVFLAAAVPAAGLHGLHGPHAPVDLVGSGLGVRARGGAGGVDGVTIGAIQSHEHGAEVLLDEIEWSSFSGAEKPQNNIYVSGKNCR